MKTVLADRELWFDGYTTIEPQFLVDYIDQIEKVSVTEMTDEIVQYNQLMDKSKQIGVKQNLNPIHNEWSIPKAYQEINIEEYVTQLHEWLCEDSNWGKEETEKRNARVQCELALFRKNELFPLLKALIYIINTLKQRDEVWGTGRGSSVSSYVLFILEVHDVDSFLYELDITDFIK